MAAALLRKGLVGIAAALLRQDCSDCRARTHADGRGKHCLPTPWPEAARRDGSRPVRPLFVEGRGVSAGQEYRKDDGARLHQRWEAPPRRKGSGAALPGRDRAKQLAGWCYSFWPTREVL